MQARVAQALIYNLRCVRTSHLVSGDKTARRVLSLVILACISSTNTQLNVLYTFPIQDELYDKSVLDVLAEGVHNSWSLLHSAVIEVK